MIYFREENIRIPIYDYEITLVLTTDLNSFCTERTGEPFITTPICNIYDYHGRESDIDFLAVFRLDKLYSNCIAHESFHITARIMRYIGITLVEESEEAYAYLIDYIDKIFNNKLIRMRKELINLIKEEDGFTGESEKIREATSRSTKMETK